jgi:hypothetical protein
MSAQLPNLTQIRSIPVVSKMKYAEGRGEAISPLRVHLMYYGHGTYTKNWQKFMVMHKIKCNIFLLKIYR